MFADLHLHTTASDGINTPTKDIIKGEKYGDMVKY